MTKRESQLSYLDNEERLKIYQLLLDGCQHLWTKGKMDKEKVKKILNDLIPLTIKDVYFLAHLTSYIIKNSDSKDLRATLTYVNALSSADGSPFSPNSKYFKPNLRYISAAAVQSLEPKLVERILEIGNLKYQIPNYFNESRHFPRFLGTAIKKYILFRELNINMVKGIKKAGLAKTFENLYRYLHLAPKDEVAAILRWQQKNKKIKFEKPEIDFKGLSDLEIAKVIRKKKLPVLGALGALSQANKKVSPVIAVALLEQATGNQAVILRRTFEDEGVLKDKEVMELYKKKISESKTALDRAETISKNASEEVKRVLKEARAEKRKEQVGDVGKIYLHIDASGSMEPTIELAKEKGAIIAEVVQNPKENFGWGLFSVGAEELPIPDEFVADAFKVILFGRTAGGGTDAFSLYPTARQFGADVDIFVSDGAHNVGDLATKIKLFHEGNPDLSKPKACVIIKFPYPNIYSGENDQLLKEGYEANGIPVAIIKPEALSNSALVSTAIREAIRGPVAVIDQIMQTPLLELPQWFYSI